MTTKQAKEIPVGTVIALKGCAVKGIVVENTPEISNGFLVRWADGEGGWIDYRGAKDVFVPGLPGTR